MTNDILKLIADRETALKTYAALPADAKSIFCEKLQKNAEDFKNTYGIAVEDFLLLTCDLFLKFLKISRIKLN